MDGRFNTGIINTWKETFLLPPAGSLIFSGGVAIDSDHSAISSSLPPANKQDSDELPWPCEDTKTKTRCSLTLHFHRSPDFDAEITSCIRNNDHRCLNCRDNCATTSWNEGRIEDYCVYISIKVRLWVHTFYTVLCYNPCAFAVTELMLRLETLTKPGSLDFKTPPCCFRASTENILRYNEFLICLGKTVLFLQTGKRVV